MRRAIALLLLSCLVVSCRTPLPGVVLPADDPRPFRLLEGLHRSVMTRSALRASARLSLAAPDLRFNRPQRLAVARPARLRVEILGLFNQIGAVLVTDGESYRIYNADRLEIEEGLVSAGLLWRVARIDLGPVEAVDLLLGAPVPRPGLSLGEARILEDGGVHFDRRDERGMAIERFAFDAEGRLRRFESLDASAELVWRADFDDYRTLPGRDGAKEPFAFEISLHFPRVGAKAKITFKSVSLARDLPDEIFVLELPGQASRLPAPSGSGPS